MRTEALDPTSRFLAYAAVIGSATAAFVQFATEREVSLGGLALGGVVVGTYGFFGAVMGGLLARRPDDRWYSRIQRGWLVPLVVALLILLPVKWGYAILGNSAGPFVGTTNATAGCASLLIGLVAGFRWGAGAFCRGIAVGAGLGFLGYVFLGQGQAAYLLSGVLIACAISAWCLTEGCSLFSRGISTERWWFVAKSIGLFTLIGLFPGPMLAPILQSVCLPVVIHLIVGALVGATLIAIVEAARRLA